jgi:hypothetical protein
MDKIETKIVDTFKKWFLCLVILCYT